MRGRGGVGARIVVHRPSEICVSALTVAELRHAAHRRRSAKLHRLIDSFTSNVAVMPFDEACATRFGLIAGELAKRGASIGEFDVLIAAHAMTLDVALVTNDPKRFSRIRVLKIENWAALVGLFMHKDICLLVQESKRQK